MTGPGGSAADTALGRIAGRMDAAKPPPAPFKRLRRLKRLAILIVLLLS